MNEFNPEQHRIETASALELVNEVVGKAGAIERHAAYVGLDVHKETIAVAVGATLPVSGSGAPYCQVHF
jgi:hypothetical protein